MHRFTRAYEHVTCGREIWHVASALCVCGMCSCRRSRVDMWCDVMPYVVASVELGEAPAVRTAASLFQEFCYNNKDRLMAGIICAGEHAHDHMHSRSWNGERHSTRSAARACSWRMACWYISLTHHVTCTCVLGWDRNGKGELMFATYDVLMC